VKGSLWQECPEGALIVLVGWAVVVLAALIVATIL
jgi:hypothetical protein